MSASEVHNGVQGMVELTPLAGHTGNSGWQSSVPSSTLDAAGKKRIRCAEGKPAAKSDTSPPAAGKAGSSASAPAGPLKGLEGINTSDDRVTAIACPSGALSDALLQIDVRRPEGLCTAYQGVIPVAIDQYGCASALLHAQSVVMPSKHSCLTVSLGISTCSSFTHCISASASGCNAV